MLSLLVDAALIIVQHEQASKYVLLPLLFSLHASENILQKSLDCHFQRLTLNLIKLTQAD